MSTSHSPRATGSRFKIALLMFTGGFGLAMAAGAASAATDNATPSLVVRYSSASLVTDSGVRQLYRQILVAARQVCPEEYEYIRGFHKNSAVEACRAQAVARAIQQIGNTRLAALYATRSKSG